MLKKLTNNIIVIIAIMSSLVGCSKTCQTVEDYCMIANPISYSEKEDTAQTKDEIKIHNHNYWLVCADKE